MQRNRYSVNLARSELQTVGSADENAHTLNFILTCDMTNNYAFAKCSPFTIDLTDWCLTARQHRQIICADLWGRETGSGS